MFFHLCEVVQIFQRESIFCNKRSSGGALFIKKLVPGGTNYGGSIFTMTVPDPPFQFFEGLVPRLRRGTRCCDSNHNP